MIILFWALSLFLLYFLLENRKKKRIDELVELIDNMKDKNYTFPMKQDDFSVLEDKIYKLFIEIVEAKESVDENSKRQVEYLEDIAHQIKTPITSMLFSLENLEGSYPEDENISLLKRQILRLNSLSDILLKLSSLDAKENLMKKESVNLQEIIDYALDNVNLKRNLKINIDDRLKENNIYVDFYWVSEAVINILKNANNRKSCDEISILLDKNPLSTSIIIEDNGGGIEKENLNKIFKRFYKTPDSNGFGIGLAMAKSIIEKNNGEIFVKNKNDGASFEIKFYNVT
ncbi:sensor histidine kinase [Peptoniphilus sp.]|jgi:signal transduction histidine kinase|uniref:sensor histidine kinase n=1 Tax=Peptoniphilus sp. TaxID=1971214 RepID=UPI003D90E131